MADWNSALYMKFERETTRAARDLLAQIPKFEPDHIIDLRCGPVNATELLSAAFPRARVVGRRGVKHFVWSTPPNVEAISSGKFYGWSALDVFGVHPAAPSTTYDPLIRGGDVVAIGRIEQQFEHKEKHYGTDLRPQPG